MLRPIALFSAALTFSVLSACSTAPQTKTSDTTARPARPASTESGPGVAARPAATDDGMEPGGEEKAKKPRFIECAKEIGIKCPSGYMDGCTKNLTLYHVCVKQDAKPGPPCEQESAKRCFPGEDDACLVDPAVAKTHICFKR